MVRKIFIIILIYIFTLQAQQFLDEMILEDISGSSEVKTSIVRDPEQALLIIISPVPDIGITSNNKIISIEKKDSGRWYVHLVPGTHRITIQSRFYLSVQKRLYFKAKETKGVKISVKEREKIKETGFLVIKSLQDSLKIYINDEFRGYTPFQERMQTGKYALRVQKELYHDNLQIVNIKENDILSLNINLVIKRTGTLFITSNPKGALVEINGQVIGKTPLIKHKLFLDEYGIRLTKKRYFPFDKKIVLDEKQDSTHIHADLKFIYTKLKLSGSPSGANVYLEDRYKGQLPLEINVPYGEHWLYVNKDGFSPQTIRLDVNNSSDPVSERNIILEPKSRISAFFMSLFFPGSGQIYSDRGTAGFFFGASILGGGVYGYKLYQKFLKEKENYNASLADYNNNFDPRLMDYLYNESQNDYNKMKKTNRLFYIVAGVTSALMIYNLFDVVLSFPDQEANDMNITFDTQKNTIGLTLSF